ncbi:hypothetical protein [Streptomyces sp. NPDC058394]|uniref:hypothetical protein n=1 Tax=Streptomyces sp. NPDC058394 TaxID=3346477 RepID=UPI00364BBA60
MTTTAPEPTTAELLGIDKSPAPRSAGLAGLTKNAAGRNKQDAEPLPDFTKLPETGRDRLQALEEILRQAEGSYTRTMRAAKERFTVTGGLALSMIRDEDLWLDADDAGGPYADFFAYAKAVWGYEKSHVYLLLDSVRVREVIKDKDAHLNTAHLKVLGPAVRSDGPDIVQLAWEEARRATGGKITAPSLAKALTSARSAAGTAHENTIAPADGNAELRQAMQQRARQLADDLKRKSIPPQELTRALAEAFTDTEDPRVYKALTQWMKAREKTKTRT